MGLLGGLLKVAGAAAVVAIKVSYTKSELKKMPQRKLHELAEKGNQAAEWELERRRKQKERDSYEGRMEEETAEESVENNVAEDRGGGDIGVVGVEGINTDEQMKKASFVDERDGQEYRTVKMPDGKIWMAQNLNYKIDGSWALDDDETNAAKYGRLYTWEAAKAACPEGWHLPTRGEWAALVEALGGDKAGAKLKAKSGWKSGNFSGAQGTDDYEFSALPGGGRDRTERFRGDGEYGWWWTATANGKSDAYNQTMSYCSATVNHGQFNNDKSSGCSVRCVKNMP